MAGAVMVREERAGRTWPKGRLEEEMVCPPTCDSSLASRSCEVLKKQGKAQESARVGRPRYS